MPPRHAAPSDDRCGPVPLFREDLAASPIGPLPCDYSPMGEYDCIRYVDRHQTLEQPTVVWDSQMKKLMQNCVRLEAAIPSRKIFTGGPPRLRGASGCRVSGVQAE